MENENEKKTADTAVRKKPDMDKLTELIIVIMLGITALGKLDRLASRRKSGYQLRHQQQSRFRGQLGI